MILGNTLFDYLYALVAFSIAMVLSLCIKYVVVKRLKPLTERTKNTVDDFIVSLLASMSLPFYIVISFYIAAQVLSIHPIVRKVIDAIFVICIVYQLIKVLAIFLDFSLAKKVNDANGSNVAHVKDLIQLVIKTSLWAVGLLFVLSNLGVNITSLVAGLGIGGIAVALAVQNILSDLFSYFAIYFDKPFVKGDLITIGTQVGVVEKVGVKTTRIRALQGEEIVISNSELTSSRIQNFKKMEERRVVFSFRVVYETPLDKLEKIPQCVKEIITSTERTRFDRAHLQAFGDSAYVFEVVYYVQSAVYNEYMDVNQAIHFKIIAMFDEEGIEFSSNAQTVHLDLGNKILS
jgi:small-conductance mechanosensitive channel